MIGSYEKVKMSALKFAARFGFITQELFFDYICPLSQDSKYVHWRRLKHEQLLKDAFAFKDVRYLTPAGRNAVGGKAVPTRPIYFIEHDKLAAKMYFELLDSCLVTKSWTEYELKKAPWEACALLGSNTFDKAPDLAVDLRSKAGFVRVAIEIERSRKANIRYDQLALRYLGLKNVHLMLFCCNKSSTARAIERAFQGDVFRRAGKIPTTFLMADFVKLGVTAEAKFLNKRMNLKHLLLAATGLPESAWGKLENTGNKSLLNEQKGVA